MVTFTRHCSRIPESGFRSSAKDYDDSNLNVIIAAWRHGNPGAGEELYRRFFGPVTTIVEHYLNRRFRIRFDVEDMVQQVFFDLLNQLRHRYMCFASDAGATVWIRSFARNRVVKRVRHESAAKRSVARERREQLDGSWASILVDRRTQTTRSTEACLDERIDGLPALSQLEPVCLSIMRLYRSGKSQLEVASALGLTTRTIRRKTKIIREVLAPQLSNDRTI